MPPPGCPWPRNWPPPGPPKPPGPCCAELSALLVPAQIAAPPPAAITTAMPAAIAVFLPDQPFLGGGPAAAPQFAGAGSPQAGGFGPPSGGVFGVVIVSSGRAH